ncbi:tetratricopeptide repeat-containing sensor histidine kinase [Terrimonas pollutisoli]|uniref:tetratricopeptide repeat-containing sensor histidine kinase n=1 Tax=Terrimonas pollutisoli TaxID=3034147 RepID=UPI0023EAB31D|nr:tetratricopeptide repeat protein [Terrimonas sp. H1YJ31]
MRHLKFILTFSAQILLIVFCAAQNEIIRQQEEQIYEQHRLQKARIDSLQRILLTAKDTVRVNCLNRSSPEYLIFNTDTAWNYAKEAYELAVKLNFTKGIAESLQNLGQITQERSDIHGAEKYFRQVPDLYKEIHALKEYNNAIRILGYNFLLQLRFDEARTLFEKTLPYYKGIHDEERMAYTYRVIGKTYEAQGYYEKAFEYFRKDMDISRKLVENGSRRSLFMWGNYYMANLYKDAGDEKTALVYYRLSAQRAKENKLPDIYNSRMGDMYVLLHNYDSARYYYERAHYLITRILADPVIRKTFLSDPEINIGETYLAQKKYDKALEYFINPLQFSFPTNPFTMRVLYDVAWIYEGQKKTTQCFQYAKQLLKVAQTTGARQYIRDGYELYWKLYDQQGKTDSAYKYSLLYTAMKDSLARDVQLRNMGITEMKIEDEQQESKITLLSKEKKIQQQQKQILFICMIGFTLLSIVVFRNILLKRRNEIIKRKQIENALNLQKSEADRTKAELQQQATELEMQALRAQMNPHFIFNSLNSINRFILQNNKAKASEYLTKFSKLVRMILQNSQVSLITLESELEALKLYLDLEALRFEHHFTYKISVPKDMDVEILKVPPLIIQPYAENAIWHGLMHKEEKGDLDIEMIQEGDYLFVKITDDGIGRKHAAELASKSATRHKSMGLKITADRIAMLQRLNGNESPVTINDLVNADGSAAGTEVIIKIPVLYA